MGNTQSKKSLNSSKNLRVLDEPIYDDYLETETTPSSENEDIDFIPIDPYQVEKPGTQHHLYKRLFSGNFSSPIHRLLETGANVLDIGCGCGSWILEMAKEYPQTSFVGIDAYPFYPTDNIPPNVEFIQINILDGIPMEDETFDFVHIRQLSSAIKTNQWESVVLKEVSRVLKPDCTFEWMEPEFRIKNMGENTRKLMDALIAGFRTRSLNTGLADQIPRMITSTGSFVIESKVTRQAPYGRWGGKLGELNLRSLKMAFITLKKLSIEFMSIYSEEYDQLIEELAKEVEVHHTYLDHWRFCIKKIPSK